MTLPPHSPFAYARASAVPNAGIDFDSSARHRYHQWRSIEEAEANGTAEQLITRDQLLKNDPPKFSTDLSALAAYWILKALPPSPKYSGRELSNPTQARAQYYQLYQDFKAFLQTEATLQSDPFKLLTPAQRWCSRRVQELRATDRYNPVANGLCGTIRKLRYRDSKRYSSTEIGSKIVEFLDVYTAHGVQLEQAHPAQYEQISAYVSAILRGKTIDQAFGIIKTAEPKFKEADQYSSETVRVGGRTFERYDQNLLLLHFKLSGIQFGQYVSDRQRQIHVQCIAEALADLADVIGWNDSDIALNGLGIAIGARGRSTAKAHYDPSFHVTNLTRDRGAGSLAHEWGHGFDHCLFDRQWNKSKARFLSTSLREAPSLGIETSLVAAMQAVLDAMKSSGYQYRLQTVVTEMISNGQMSLNRRTYWLSIEEQFARCFERYVQETLRQQDRENSYLAGNKCHPLWMNKAEVKAISPAMTTLLKCYQQIKG